MKLDFSNANVLVMGDVMLDSYWQGVTERISPEAPVPVVRVNDSSWRIGGSGNVALNVSSLGAKVSLLAMIGEDSDGDKLMGLINNSEISNHCLVDSGVTTTNKLRILSQHQQLIRLDFEQAAAEINAQSLLDRFESLLPGKNMVVLSDYGKGLLKNVSLFIERANQMDVPVLIDPKAVDFSGYSGAYLLTPNQKELEAVVGKLNSQQALVEKAGQVVDSFNLQGLLVTQGEQGMTLVLKGHPAEHFPAHTQEVYDVTGAGDTVIATLATGLGSGLSVQDSVFLSCRAAGIVVGRMGTASVSVKDLKKIELSDSSKLSSINDKVVNHTDLLQRINRYRESGKKIVITNGCFDLMHTGHVRYLEQASALGDVLIVAVNDDSSVSRLKGNSRPINKLVDRMEMLAGLASVDLVTEFSEDTPAELICSIKPDILVKGGDYEVEQIAGRDCAKEVVLIDFIDGKSSSELISKIQGS